MVIEHNNEQYKVLLGRDLINEGTWIEMKDTDGEMVLFAFWSKGDREFTFHAYREELPFEVVERFIQTARQHLPAATPT